MCLYSMKLGNWHQLPSSKLVLAETEQNHHVHTRLSTLKWILQEATDQTHLEVVPLRWILQEALAQM